MRFRHLERLVNHLPVLVRAVHLPSERLGVDLDLLTCPSHEPCTPLAPLRRTTTNAPEAIRLSLNAAMYHSQVFLIRVKHTIASSEMYMLMSPSNLI